MSSTTPEGSSPPRHAEVPTSRPVIPAILSLAITGLLLRILATNEVTVYLARSTQWLLWISAAVLGVMGLWSLLGQCAGSTHGTLHKRVWPLMLIPLIAVGLLGPGPLKLAVPAIAAKPSKAARPGPVAGPAKPDYSPVTIDPETGRTEGGYAADIDQNEKNEQGTSRQLAIDEPEVKLEGDPIHMTIYDYVALSQMNPGKIKGKRVQLEGMASRDPDNPDGPWVLVRFKIWCCAADAMPFMVTATGADQPQLGTWVRITGTTMPATSAGDARLAVTSVEPIPEPDDPYMW